MITMYRRWVPCGFDPKNGRMPVMVLRAVHRIQPVIRFANTLAPGFEEVVGGKSRGQMKKLPYYAYLASSRQAK